MVFLNESFVFPKVDEANEDGLLAIGGDLSPERLLLAYRSGIFPWYSEDEPILWWSPDPRMVLIPTELHISKSMKKLLRDNVFSVTFNQCFTAVIEQCSNVIRGGQRGTWITSEMKEAYIHLHEKGYAKSVEVWKGDQLVGGLYGVDLGHVFCGESMFSILPNTSKYGFIKWVQYLEQQDYALVDCQVHTDHLERLGAKLISRESFISCLSS